MKILNNLQNIETFIELIPDIAFIKDLDGHYTHCNQALLNFMMKSREEIIGKTDFDLFSYDNALKIRETDRDILTCKEPLGCNESQHVEEMIASLDADDFYFSSVKQIIANENEEILGLFCIAQDISSKKQYEFIYEDSETILESIAIHDDFQTLLDEIVYLAQKRKPNSQCSILLLDKAKKHLLKGSAPSLPDFYNDAVEGLEIGESVGSCGSAAFTKKRVIVDNIDKHPNWAGYLQLTTKANLHSCWSEPIISSNGEVLGTFAIYTSKATYPTPFELKLINTYAHLASVAIEKFYNEELIREQEYRIYEQTLLLNQELEKKQDELSLLLDNALVGLMYITGERILIKGNQRLADILGYDDPQEMVGLSMREIHLSEERFHDFGAKNFYTLVEKENFDIEYQLKRKDGSFVWCKLSGKALDPLRPADLSKGVLWTISDISQRKLLEEQILQRSQEIELQNIQLQKLASKDHLRGLYNRSKLDEKLEYQLKFAKRTKRVFGLILVDIDFFKLVNDTYGHQTGDKILCEFSSILTEQSREIDFIGRWGGEEFMIIVEEVNKESIINFAKKLRKCISEHTFSIIGHKTASFGVTLYKDEDTPTSIVSRVDTALYEAKDEGRDRVVFLS